MAIILFTVVDNLSFAIEIGARTIASITRKEFNIRRRAHFNQRWGKLLLLLLFRIQLNCIFIRRSNKILQAKQISVSTTIDNKFPLILLYSVLNFYCFMCCSVNLTLVSFTTRVWMRIATVTITLSANIVVSLLISPNSCNNISRVQFKFQASTMARRRITTVKR